MRAEAWLLGETRSEVRGALPAAFLNECARRGVYVGQTEAVDEFTLRISLRTGELPRARKAAAHSGCELTVLGQRGAPEGLRAVRRRLALCAGLLSVLLALFASSLFIWEIHVAENDTPVPDGRILSVLARQGVGVGSFWPGFQSDLIRSRALAELPELSWLAVNVRGSRAEVLVRGALPAPELRDESTPTEVTARRAGVIAELRVLEGESVVSVGDTVLAGELLVSSRRYSSFGGDRIVHARAEVKARTWYEITAVAPLSLQRRVPEGASHSRWGLILGKRRVNFSHFSRIPKSSCDIIISTYPLAVPGVFTLPVSLLRETWQPVTPEETAVHREETAARLEAALEKTLRERMGEGEVVFSHITRSFDGGAGTVPPRAECLERIDTERPAAND